MDTNKTPPKGLAETLISITLRESTIRPSATFGESEASVREWGLAVVDGWTEDFADSCVCTRGKYDIIRAKKVERCRIVHEFHEFHE